MCSRLLQVHRVNPFSHLRAKYFILKIKLHCRAEESNKKRDKMYEATVSRHKRGYGL